MLFSIIIPIYKVEEYLNQCVDSVLAQDFKDYELILVDDGSPDRCPQICDEYAEKDSRIVVIHKENGGLSDARNAGILKAQGEYIVFIDSDDYWDNMHALSLIADKVNDEHTDIIAYGRKRLYNGELQDCNHRYFSEYKGLDPAETLYSLVADGKLYVTAWAMSLRRSFVLENHLLFKKGIKSEDIEWGIRLFALEPSWAFLTEVFYVYRAKREGSITSTVDYAHTETYYHIIKDSIDVVQSCSPKTKYALLSYIMYHALICNAWISRTELSSEQRKDLHEKLKPIFKEYLLKYDLNKKVKLSGMIYRVFGYFGITKVLGFYLIHRGR
ncbi:MAG: glycosyltransferase family 2 protein [Oscillospiraceae bacterium]|nr:glycosyltransferase family 2 protein [Oscillospiraceae bacterium]